MEQKLFSCILAGGSGTRMGKQEKPKQFIELNGKPIVIHTIEKFFLHQDFTKIIVLTHKNWIKHMEDYILEFFGENTKIVVVEAGETRNETIMNSIKYIESINCLTTKTYIITHDGVRPFVSYRIIKENIDNAIIYGACDTVIEASDTIVMSCDGEKIDDIPERSNMYLGQTPQSFNALKLKKHYEQLSKEEKELLTDAAKIMLLKGEKVHLVRGEAYNIKITYPFDIKVAESLIKADIISE